MSAWIEDQAMEYIRLANDGDNRKLKAYCKDRPDAWKKMISDELKRIDMYDHVPIKRLKLKDTP